MANNNLKKIIELLPPSEFDDFFCKDGEVLDGEWLFPAEPEQQPEPNPGEGSGSGPDKEPESSGTTTTRPVLKPGEVLFSLPQGSHLLLTHKVDEPSWNVIFRDSAGNLRWQAGESSTSGVIADAAVVGNVRQAVDVGKYLVFISDKGLLFALWSNSTVSYLWLGAIPSPPALTLNKLDRCLPPYSYVDGDLPQVVAEFKADQAEADTIIKWLAATDTMSITSALKARVRNAIGESIAAFLKDVEASGLWFESLYVAGCWMTDNEAWRPSVPMFFGESGNLKLRISDVSFSSDIFRIRLTLSRSPFVVSVRLAANGLTAAWKSVVDGMKIYCGRERSSLISNAVSDAVFLDASNRGFEIPCAALPQHDPKEEPLTSVATVPLDSSGYELFRPSHEGYAALDYFDYFSSSPNFIRNINSRLIAVWSLGSKNNKNRISVSASYLPFMVTGENELGGDRLINVMHSLRSLSSGQLGEFPLHAFASDGIRALTPKNNSFVDVQLISRDVALSEDGFAPLPNGTAFITRRGVMEIDGTSVSCLSDNLEAQLKEKRDFRETDRLAYDYATNALILYNLAESKALFYLRSSKTWHRLEWIPDNHCYLWPVLLVVDGYEIKNIRMETVEETVEPQIRRLASFPPGPTVTLKTRPIKLTTPFELKKLKRVEGIWPDGESHPFAVYGCLKPGLWRILGRSEGNPIRLEGSGWRFFMLEISIKRPENENYDEIKSIAKPLIMIEFRKER